MKLLSTLIFLFFTCWGLTSCGNGPEAVKASGLNPTAPELRFALLGDPKGFDPLHPTEENGEMIRYITGGVLVRINRATDAVEPVLAESWKIEDAGRAIHFHLRTGLRFSDGSALDANDVERTLRRALDPKEASPTGDTFRSGKDSPEIQVRSPLDLVLRYPAPKPGLDRLFDQLAIAPRLSGNAGAKTLPPSAGPFYVAEYKPAAYVRLARNPYFSPRPKLDSIRLDIQQTREIELSGFLKGDLHLVNHLEPEAFDRVKAATPAAATNLGASLGADFLWFNQAPAKNLPEWKRSWFRSSAFRHAISASIRREDLARIAYKGYARPAAGPFSPANVFWFNRAIKPRAYDSAAALQYLKQAGFAIHNGVLQDSAGHAVEFSIVTNAGNEQRTRMAAIIQSDLKKIGIQVNIVPLDFNSLVDRIGKSFDYEACLLGFANVEIDPVEQNNVWLSSGQQHAWWPSQKTPATPWEAEIDRLMLLQSSEANRALRKKAFDRVQQIAFDEEPILYLVHPDFLAALSPRLRGVEPVAVPPQLVWNIEKLSVQ